ncbi:MAG: hypothetical protein K2O67_03880, partial [Clostridia bacterium]|nr:hypothetical protein [Clostridia bacterium]
VEKLKVIASTHPWKEEIPALVDALDEILGISTAEDFEFDEGKLTNSLSTLFSTLNDDSDVAPGVTTRLGVCYRSEIIRNTMTVRLDELLDGAVGQNLLNSAKELGYYKKAELSSLCSALNLFEIELEDFDADKLTESVKEKIFTLNDPAEEGGERTKLDVVYPSVIFTGLFSEELYRALLDNTDEDRNQAPMIEEETLWLIKGGSRYSKEELKNLINSINVFGITSFEEIDTLDFDTVKQKTEEEIDEICLSLVIRGVMTYQIAQSDGIDVNHPLAYEEGINILHTSEISSLITLINSLPEQTDLEEMYFEEISLSSVKENTFRQDGSVKSYLLLKSVSTSVKNSSHLSVNDRLIDSYGCINHTELYKLIDAIITVQGTDNVNLYDFTELNYPDLNKEQRAEVFGSEILRAKLTEQLISENKPKEGQPQAKNYISGKNFTKYTDWRTRNSAYVISETELNALF